MEWGRGAGLWLPVPVRSDKIAGLCIYLGEEVAVYNPRRTHTHWLPYAARLPARNVQIKLSLLTAAAE